MLINGCLKVANAGQITKVCTEMKSEKCIFNSEQVDKLHMQPKRCYTGSTLISY